MTGSRIRDMFVWQRRRNGEHVERNFSGHTFA